jgi:hypothetical protein
VWREGGFLAIHLSLLHTTAAAAAAAAAAAVPPGLGGGAVADKGTKATVPLAPCYAADENTKNRWSQR